MVLTPNTTGCAFVESAPLTPHWDLRLGPPQMTPSCSYQAYLPSILTGVLKNGLPWTTSWLGQIMSAWLGQIMSAAAWMQVVLFSGFKWDVALH